MIQEGLFCAEKWTTKFETGIISGENFKKNIDSATNMLNIRGEKLQKIKDFAIYIIIIIGGK
jgi:hypothetical protein